MSCVKCQAGPIVGNKPPSFGVDLDADADADADADVASVPGEARPSSRTPVRGDGDTPGPGPRPAAAAAAAASVYACDDRFLPGLLIRSLRRLESPVDRGDTRGLIETGGRIPGAGADVIGVGFGDEVEMAAAALELNVDDPWSFPPRQ